MSYTSKTMVCYEEKLIKNGNYRKGQWRHQLKTSLKIYDGDLRVELLVHSKYTLWFKTNKNFAYIFAELGGGLWPLSISFQLKASLLPASYLFMPCFWFSSRVAYHLSVLGSLNLESPCPVLLHPLLAWYGHSDASASVLWDPLLCFVVTALS